MNPHEQRCPARSSCRQFAHTFQKSCPKKNEPRPLQAVHRNRVRQGTRLRPLARVFLFRLTLQLPTHHLARRRRAFHRPVPDHLSSEKQPLITETQLNNTTTTQPTNPTKKSPSTAYIDQSINLKPMVAPP